MKNLTEENVCRLALSPLQVLYLVASAYLEPERITERHVVRAVEYGLRWETPFSEGVFELLRSHLHEFYAEFPATEMGHPAFEETLRAELLSVRQLLEQLSGPPAMIDDFKAALKNLAAFVAGGGAFRRELEHPGMRSRAEWIVELLNT